MNKRGSLVGERFGRLEVLSFESTEEGKKYLCFCDCGNFRFCRGKSLQNSQVKSCGCGNKERFFLKATSKIGAVFGRLTIVGVESGVLSNGEKKNYMICRCECGSESKKIYAELKSGKVVSCGCHQREMASKTGTEVGVNNCNKTRFYIYEKGEVKIFMRSSYELIFANLLDSKGLAWEYEPKVFKLKDGMRYKPDFYIPKTDEWYEVKGFMDEKSQEKIDLFQHQGNKITVIDLEYLEKETGMKYKLMKKKWTFFN